MKEKTTITFIASECGEFPALGESIECTSLKEAFRYYKKFLKRSPEMCPSLDFSLHHTDNPLYDEKGSIRWKQENWGENCYPLFLTMLTILW